MLNPIHWNMLSSVTPPTRATKEMSRVLTVITFPLLNIILNAPFPWSPYPPSYIVRFIPIASHLWHCPRNDLCPAAIPTTMMYEFLFSQIYGVCSQQCVKHELRPLLPLQKQRLWYIKNEHCKEGTTGTPHPTKQNK